MKGPELSLCIVARNEAGLVADAIASAQPVVDEVVVVDTGSTDQTREVARRAGARVLEAPWPGDLAQAHDLPVAHARGQWVLVLDADEVLDPDERDGIRELIRSGGCDGYALPVRNYTYGWWDGRWRAADPHDPLTRGAVGYIPTAPIRLFRGDPAHRFTGALHQTIVPSIQANGGRIGDGDVPIHHYGFLRFDRDKSDLYRRLASQQVAARPDDPRSWIDLGILLGEAGELPDAADAFRRARRLGDRGDATFLLGSAVMDMGRADAAIPLLQEAVHASEEDTHHFDRADAWDALGQAFEQVGRVAQAESAYRRAAHAHKPGATANLVGLLIDAGRLDEAERLLDDLLPRFRGIDVLWSLRGVARLRVGDAEGAAAALRVALDIRPENLAARMNLAVASRRAGRPQEAERAYAAASEAIGSDEARRLRLEQRLPRRHRARPVTLPERPGLVLSVVPALAGGGGRVLVDAVRALAGRPQLVACTSAQDYAGQGLRDELAEIGVDVVTVHDELALQRLVLRTCPAVVLQHWWRGSVFRSPLRVTNTRWICIGHAGLPMPLGYDAWITNSAYHRSFQTHLPAERVVDIPNGVDLDRYRPAARATAEPVTVVMLSRLDPGKFPRLLLRHLPALDGARLLIAGFGARRHEIEPELADHDLDGQVRFLGPVRSVDVPQLLASADVGLHLTEMHRELCSMSILEMLASGLPVVAEPKGGVPEMVEHGVNGFLADEPEAVASHLRRLIDDAGLRRRMGAASRQVAGRYDMKRYGEAIRSLVADVERGGGHVGPAGTASAADRAVQAVTPPSTTYLICATPRSGSNLLCEALRNTGLAGHPHEFFAPPFEATLTGRWGTDSVADYLEELQIRMSTPNHVFGLKIMAADLEGLLTRLRATAVRDDQRDADVLAAVLPGVRYVWLRRADRLRQAVSWLRAKQTDMWVGGGSDDERFAPAPRYDRAALAQHMNQIDTAEQRWTDLFADAGVPPIRVDYEDLAGDYEGTARRVVSALGVAVPQDLVLGPRRLQAQADDLTEQWVERFRSEAVQAS